jgi:hypothetical protein
MCCIPPLTSSDFSVLFFVPQTCPYLFGSSFSFVKLFHSYFVRLYRSSDSFVYMSLLFSVLLSARHLLDGPPARPFRPVRPPPPPLFGVAVPPLFRVSFPYVRPSSVLGFRPSFLGFPSLLCFGFPSLLCLGFPPVRPSVVGIGPSARPSV